MRFNAKENLLADLPDEPIWFDDQRLSAPKNMFTPRRHHCLCCGKIRAEVPLRKNKVLFPWLRRRIRVRSEIGIKPIAGSAKLTSIAKTEVFSMQQCLEWLSESLKSRLKFFIFPCPCMNKRQAPSSDLKKGAERKILYQNSRTPLLKWISSLRKIWQSIHSSKAR